MFSHSLTVPALPLPPACPERDEGSIAKGQRGEGALGMPRALTRGRGYDHDGEPPCSMDGWLYPTPAFAGASLAHPPLTKGRKTTALLSWFPSCGQPLILSTPVLSLSKGMTEPLQSPTLSFCHPRHFPLCHPRRLSPTFPLLSSGTFPPSVILDISNRGSSVVAFSFSQPTTLDSCFRRNDRKGAGMTEKE